MAVYYVVCDDDCRYEGMTKEQILTAIEQAVSQGHVSDPDNAVISKIKEIRANEAIQIWTGTEAQFNALDPAPTVGNALVRVGTDGVLYLCSDDSTFDFLNQVKDIILAIPAELSKRDRVVNLLDNSDFRNPVNQRGQTVYSGYGYTIDRWRQERGISTSTVTVGDGYITLTSATEQCWITQVFEHPLTEGKTYTAFAELQDGTVNVCSFVATANQVYDLGSGFIWAVWTTSLGLVVSEGAAPVSIKRVALYEGAYTAETIPTYQPKGYGAELAECMRYYQVGEKMRRTETADYNGALPIVDRFPIPMRVAPTVTFKSISVWKRDTATSNTTESFDTPTIVEITPYGFFVYLSSQGSKALTSITYEYVANADL